ncbi:hypothetical protein DFJ74DRAFT_728966, partial [Hyaloraphidium curvatum]
LHGHLDVEPDPDLVPADWAHHRRTHVHRLPSPAQFAHNGLGPGPIAAHPHPIYAAGVAELPVPAGQTEHVRARAELALEADEAEIRAVSGRAGAWRSMRDGSRKPRASDDGFEGYRIRGNSVRIDRAEKGVRGPARPRRIGSRFMSVGSKRLKRGRRPQDQLAALDDPAVLKRGRPGVAPLHRVEKPLDLLVRDWRALLKPATLRCCPAGPVLQLCQPRAEPCLPPLLRTARFPVLQAAEQHGEDERHQHGHDVRHKRDGHRPPERRQRRGGLRRRAAGRQLLGRVRGAVRGRGRMRDRRHRGRTRLQRLKKQVSPVGPTSGFAGPGSRAAARARRNATASSTGEYGEARILNSKRLERYPSIVRPKSGPFALHD